MAIQPAVAFAQSSPGSGRGDDGVCSGSRSDDDNPQCRAPEVPATALFPALGLVSLAGVELVRARRRDALSRR